MIPANHLCLLLLTMALEGPAPLTILADKQTEAPLTMILAEYRRRTGQQVKVDFLPTAEVEALVRNKPAGFDLVLGMPAKPDAQTGVSALAGARKIVWKYPGGEPVWLAVVSKHPAAEEFSQFVGRPTAQRLWAGEPGTKVCFVCMDHHAANRAEQYQWVVDHRLWHTYRMTALRMLGEIGGIREGTITNARLREIVQATGLPNAQVVDQLGQWVKIIGPGAPKEAHQFVGGPSMLAGRIAVNHSLVTGDSLLLHPSDGGLEQDLQQGFLDLTDMGITALYSSQKALAKAEARIRQGQNAQRIRCQGGTVQSLPFADNSFDVVAGVGPILLWGDKEREEGMREIYRVLKPGGAALVGGMFKHMPDFRKVSSDALRKSAANTGIPSIRVYDDMGQWIEIVKGIDREPPPPPKPAGGHPNQRE